MSKEDSIQDILVKLAKTLGPDAQLPRVADLCKRLSVSRSTLDRVLRKLKADRVIICRRGAGIFVSPLSNQRRIGLLFKGDLYDHGLYSEFWSLLHGALLRIGQKNGDDIRTYFGFTDEHSQDPNQSAFALEEDLASRRLSGILTAGMPNADAFKWIKKWDLPIVHFGRGFGIADATIEFNEDECMPQALEALKSAGCKQVALIYHTGDNDGFDNETDKCSRAFKKYSEKLGLLYNASNRWTYRVLPESSAVLSFEGIGAEIVREKFLSKPPQERPDGIFFHDDAMAHGGMIALLEHGLRPGRDIQIAVLSNKGTSILRPFHQSIIRVEFDPAELAAAMFALLNKILTTGKLRERHHLLSPKLGLPNGSETAPAVPEISPQRTLGSAGTPTKSPEPERNSQLGLAAL